jgi:hypothetical protein
MATVKITYRFLFFDGRTVEHDIVLDGDTGRQVSGPVLSHRIWAQLEHKKCKQCPLKKEEHPECPVAKNLAIVADTFKSKKSFERVVVYVETAERTYRKEVRLQQGLSSLIGLIMATSDCPEMEFLRPMARFHLPFSSLQETAVRSVSLYLLKQYFVAKNGGKPDYDLKDLQKRYAAVEGVNLAMADRIRSMSDADAEANSIVILDTFAQILSNRLSSKLPDLDKLFG